MHRHREQQYAHNMHTERTQAQNRKKIQQYAAHTQTQNTICSTQKITQNTAQNRTQK